MPDAAPRQNRLRRLIVWAIVAAGIWAIVLCASPQIAGRLGRWLSVSALDLPANTQVDAIIVMGGNTLHRIVTGVDLYNDQAAPLMALTGYVPSERGSEFDEVLIARDYALRGGIPEQSFTLLHTSSTLEDAEQVADYIRQHAMQQVVIVSDWTHGRRALCTIHAALATSSTAIYFKATPAEFGTDDWWQHEEGLINVSTEIAKMSLYTLRYGIPMWECFPGDPNLLAHPILFSLGLVFSAVGVGWVRRNAVRLNRIDMPNERSLHSTPTPRGGGLGIVISVVGLWLVSLVVWPRQVNFPAELTIGYALASGLVATIGWFDDRHPLKVWVRLLSYVLISVGFVLAAGIIRSVLLPLVGEVSLAPLVGAVLTILWLVGFLNIFNFMDGINGLAGSQALLASLFWLVIFLIEGQSQLALLAALIAASSLGFLFHNLSPARIFMGDVGSTFLGFSLAALPVMGYAQTGNSRLLVIGVLFVAPFVFDGTLTILRRALRRENIFQAHRSHLYQQLVIAGYSHQRVTKQYQLLMLVSGVCGIITYSASLELMTAAALALLIVFAGYTVYVGRTQSNDLKHRSE